jgi:hypothetical protein
MTKLIITESQYNRLFNEDIDPSEAYRDENGIEAVINGRRNVGFLAVRDYNKNLIKNIKEANLKIIKLIQDNSPDKYSLIFFRSGHENQALELAIIAKKYDGYLPASPDQGITADEVYKIGRLLGYYRDKVIEFVCNKFNLRPDYFKNKNIYK